MLNVLNCVIFFYGIHLSQYALNDRLQRIDVIDLFSADSNQFIDQLVVFLEMNITVCNHCADHLVLLGLNIAVVINIIDYLSVSFQQLLINNLDQSVILVTYYYISIL